MATTTLVFASNLRTLALISDTRCMLQGSIILVPFCAYYETKGTCTVTWSAGNTCVAWWPRTFGWESHTLVLAVRFPEAPTCCKPMKITKGCLLDCNPCRLLHARIPLRGMAVVFSFFKCPGDVVSTFVVNACQGRR